MNIIIFFPLKGIDDGGCRSLREAEKKDARREDGLPWFREEEEAANRAAGRVYPGVLLLLLIL